MTSVEKQTIELFAMRSGLPYTDLLREYRAMPKVKRWKALAQMRDTERKFQAYVAEHKAGWFKRTAAKLRALVLREAVKR